MCKATGVAAGNGEMLWVMIINNERKTIEKDKKMYQKGTVWVQEATGVVVGDGETLGIMVINNKGKTIEKD